MPILASPQLGRWHTLDWGLDSKHVGSPQHCFMTNPLTNPPPLQDLDPYKAKPADPDAGPARFVVQQRFISRAEVEAKADFRNTEFLTSFVSGGCSCCGG